MLSPAARLLLEAESLRGQSLLDKANVCDASSDGSSLIDLRLVGEDLLPRRRGGRSAPSASARSRSRRFGIGR
jgi:hypothetical protein